MGWAIDEKGRKHFYNKSHNIFYCVGCSLSPVFRFELERDCTISEAELKTGYKSIGSGRG
jgi:hypothetical protein